MAEKLVIVESPTKAKEIGAILSKMGKKGEWEVVSSKGHICDISDTKDNKASNAKGIRFGIDFKNGFQPIYEIEDGKKKLVDELKKKAKTAKQVYLASDADREGEAIAWHLYHILGLTPEKTHRIAALEITKKGVEDALKNDRAIDENLVMAQQARRVLDRIEGYEISPLLWKKVFRGLSAGRVQSPVVRMVVEREREIQDFYSKLKSTFSVKAEFTLPDGKTKLTAKLKNNLKNETEVKHFLEEIKDARFTITDIKENESERNPAAPFDNPSLLADAGRKLSLTAKQTMNMLQSLFERGHITYHRTDAKTLSGEAMAAAKNWIDQKYGADYSQPKQYGAKSKGVQGAHEAIRPTDMSKQTLRSDDKREVALYELIWKRTVASQMAKAKVKNTTAVITSSIGNANNYFEATGEVILFDGFLKLYREGTDDEDDASEYVNALPALSKGDELKRGKIEAIEYFAKPTKARYSEASLVNEMRDKGIGRPSTYASTISTIEDRGYVVRKSTEGKERDCKTLTLDASGNIKTGIKTECAGKEKNKLFPTDLGCVVTDYLQQTLPQEMDYKFTANSEEDFDKIAEGKANWNDFISNFYKQFQPKIAQAMDAKSAERVGTFVLGEDPSTHLPVYAKIGKFGAFVQRGSGDGDDKPEFAPLKDDQSIYNLTLKEALELFDMPRLPRTSGSFEGSDMVVASGRFGPYIRHNNTFTSIPKTLDPLTITEQQCQDLIIAKREKEANRVINTFDYDGDVIELQNGRFGPYFTFRYQNYKLSKEQQANASKLTADDCIKIIDKTPVNEAQRAKAKARAERKATKTTSNTTAPKATKKSATKKTATKKSTKR